MALEPSPDTTRVTTLRVAIVLVFAGSLALLASHADRTRRGLDDAYITYQYATNLAHGRGFVFNAGDRPSLGTSTPLYAGLLALGGRLGMDIPLFSISVGILATSIALSLLVAIAWEVGFLSAGLVAALLASVAQLYWKWEGMETSLYLALILGAIWTTLRGREALGLALAALATITRLDGLAVLVAVGFLVAVRRAWSWRTFLPGTVLMLSWLVTAALLFGSPVPTSGLAKMHHAAGISGRFSVLSLALIHQALPTTLLVPDPIFWDHPRRATALSILLLSTPLICLALVRPRLPIAALTLWLALYLAGYEWLRLPEFGWYYGPPAIVLALFLWMALHALVRLGANAVHPRGGPVGRLAVWTIAALMLGGMVAGTLRSGEGPRARERTLAMATGWLREHAAPGDTVVAFEVGMLAYRTGLRTVDLLGLTDPDARRHLQDGDLTWAIRDRPAYVFSIENGTGTWPVARAIFRECAFALHYRPKARLPFRADTDYVIYQRDPPGGSSPEGEAAEWIDVHHPPSMRRAVTAGYSLTFRNRSPLPWHAGTPDAPFVTYEWHDALGHPLPFAAIRTSIPCDVGPGERVLVSAAVRAPDRPGTYVLKWEIGGAGGDSLGRLGASAEAPVVVD